MFGQKKSIEMNIKSEIEIVSPDPSNLHIQEFCWDCEYCNKFYATKSYRDKHMKRMHTAATCSICLETFPSISLLRKHHNNQHSANVSTSPTCDDGIWTNQNQAKSVQNNRPDGINQQRRQNRRPRQRKTRAMLLKK